MYMACKAKGNVAAKPYAMPKGDSPNPHYHMHLPSHSSHGHIANTSRLITLSKA